MRGVQNTPRFVFLSRIVAERPTAPQPINTQNDGIELIDVAIDGLNR
jgi:hypothetical protein